MTHAAVMPGIFIWGAMVSLSFQLFW